MDQQSNEIINRVANSPLITIDLEEIYPEGKRLQLDIAQWLEEGLILREKQFRETLKEFDFSPYKDAFVALHCSTDAILPGWAYLLITSHLQPYAQYITVGTLEDLDRELYDQLITEMNISPYFGKKIILKGCSRKPVPDSAYIQLAQKLLPHVDSLMFGEACSTVPLFKSGKKRA